MEFTKSPLICLVILKMNTRSDIILCLEKVKRFLEDDKKKLFCLQYDIMTTKLKSPFKRVYFLCMILTKRKPDQIDT